MITESRGKKTKIIKATKPRGAHPVIHCCRYALSNIPDAAPCWAMVPKFQSKMFAGQSKHVHAKMCSAHIGTWFAQSEHLLWVIEPRILGICGSMKIVIKYIHFFRNILFSHSWWKFVWEPLSGSSNDPGKEFVVVETILWHTVNVCKLIC